MNALLHALVYAVGILGLFLLDRDRKARTSPALWIPVIWVCIGGSRMISQWLSFSTAKPDTDQYLEGSPLDRAILTALLVIALLVVISRGQRTVALLRANWPIVLFFLYCGVSVIWSDFPDVAFKRWTKSLADLAMVIIVLTDANRTAAIKRFLARAGFLLMPGSIVLIKYYPDLGRVYDRWVGTMSITGVATDKNMLGLVCFIFGVGAVWRLTLALKDGYRTARKQLLAQGILLATALWLLWKANSMTSISCFVFASGLILLNSFPSLARRRTLVHLAVIGVLAVSVSALFFQLGSGLVQTVGRNSTLTGRTDLWQHILPMNPNPLLGTGFGSFWLGPRLEKLWSIYWWHPNESHNGYIETYLNLGWMGLFLLGVIVVTGYGHITKMLRREPDVGKLCLAYFVTGLTYNFTEAGFRTMNVVWIAFMLGCMTLPKMSARKPMVLKARVQKSPPQKAVREGVV